jgi:DNA-binding FadR family transcriptional regulator
MPSWMGTIAKQTLADKVAERIIAMIASGVLKRGDTLPSQREFAREMGISLAAVREAIQRLQVLRVVRTEQGSGMVVGEIGWQQVVLEPSLILVALEGDALRHMWEARHALENEVARLAALRATDADIAAVRAIIDKAGPYLETFEENRELNRQFHLALARAAKNPVLEEMLSGLLAMDLSAVRRIYTEEISRHSWKVHRQIFDAVARRDPRAALVAMEAHAAALDSEMMAVDAMVQGSEGPAAPIKRKRSRRVEQA